jgi:hypothetical protein
MGGLFHFKPSVQCRLLAQSGHSRHVRDLVAIGEERTMVGTGAEWIGAD